MQCYVSTVKSVSKAFSYSAFLFHKNINKKNYIDFPGRSTVLVSELAKKILKSTVYI